MQANALARPIADDNVDGADIAEAVERLSVEVIVAKLFGIARTVCCSDKVDQQLRVRVIGSGHHNSFACKNTPVNGGRFASKA